MHIQEDAAAEIERQIEQWQARLLQLPAEAVHLRPAADRWSYSEVIGHLVDSACNNHQRFIRAQTVDELTFPKYDQNVWVAMAHYRQSDWTALVSLWSGYNRILAVLIRHIPDDALTVPWVITPHESYTLGFLIADYVDHMRHHLTILERRIDN